MIRIMPDGTRLNPDGSIPDEAILDGPRLIQDIDGPLIGWSGAVHRLTWLERLQLKWGWSTIDRIACKRWPRRAQIRAHLQRRLS